MPDSPRLTAAITAVGTYLPPDRLTNADLEKLVDTNDEWIRTRTGIAERRILRDPTKATAFMATEAARQCLDEAGATADQVDCVLVATVTPDMVFPATACLVQHNLGAAKRLGLRPLGGLLRLPLRPDDGGQAGRDRDAPPGCW